MSCNHCLEPTCLEGCPVDAYSKDPLTGIVRHSADACIGCQYCTWNCSYGAPQFNPERGVVGKCDMCHGRLELGQSPACVSACPQGAIQIEIVNVADWRAAVASATAATGIPVADHSLSTTRISLPPLPPNAGPVDVTHVKPEDPHWPLVVMTVLTQLSAGALAAVWLLQLAGASTRLGVAAIGSLMVGGLALVSLDAAPRAAGARVSRASHVAALVAEPRGAALHQLLRGRHGLRRAALVRAARQRGCRRRHRGARHRRA